MAALVRFEPKAAALVLEEEIREAVISSISSAVGGALNFLSPFTESLMPPLQCIAQTSSSLLCFCKVLSLQLRYSSTEILGTSELLQPAGSATGRETKTSLSSIWL